MSRRHVHHASPASRAGNRLAVTSCVGIGLLLIGFLVASRWLGAAPTAGATAAPIGLLPPPVMMEHGQWLIADLPCTLTTSVVPEAQLPRLMSRLPNTVAGLDTSSELEQSLIARIALLANQPAQRGAIQLLKVEQDGFQVSVAIAERAGRRHLIEGRFAYRRQPGSWTVIEAVRRSDASTAQLESSSLLPLPDHARTIGRRFNSSGVLQAQFVSLDDDFSSLAVRWRQSGWQLHRHDRDGREAYLCRRDNVELYVTQPACVSGGPGALLIVRVDNSSSADKRRNA